MDWLEYIKRDENAALKEIYLDHREACIAWLKTTYRLELETSKEIFQTAVVILYDNVITGKLEVLNSNIKTYLLGIAKNQARQYLKKKQKEGGDLSTWLLSAYITEENTEKEDLERNIRYINQQLTLMGDPCRTLLQLYYYKQLSMADISSIMGYKGPDTVKAKKYQCIKRLQLVVSKSKREKYVN